MEGMWLGILMAFVFLLPMLWVIGVDWSLEEINHPDWGVPSNGIWRAVWEEVLEYIDEPSWDELSDICCGFGRCLGWFVGVPYVRFPGDNMSYRKKLKRLETYGHFRSKRHLVEDENGNWVYP
jgi:hypothetical protein